MTPDEPAGTVKIGEFTLTKSVDKHRIWIERPGGEGGDFSEADLAEIIRRFYNQRS